MKIYGVREYKQVATPSNPAIGFTKLYFKDDNNLYRLDKDGVETLVGKAEELYNSIVNTEADRQALTGLTPGDTIFIKENTKTYKVSTGKTTGADADVEDLDPAGSGTIADGSVTTVKLADNAVETAKIKNGAITKDKIGDGQVSEAKIQTDAITTTKIKNGAITKDKIGDGQVSEAKLQSDSVTTTKIKNGAITSDKIADGTIKDADLSTTLKDSLVHRTGDEDIDGTKVFKGRINADGKIVFNSDTAYKILVGGNTRNSAMGSIVESTSNNFLIDSANGKDMYLNNNSTGKIVINNNGRLTNIRGYLDLTTDTAVRDIHRLDNGDLLPDDARFRSNGSTHKRFCKAAEVGLPAGDMWAEVITNMIWNEGSQSHKVYQEAFANGTKYLRTNTSSTAWGPWEKYNFGNGADSFYKYWMR